MNGNEPFERVVDIIQAGLERNCDVPVIAQAVYDEVRLATHNNRVVENLPSLRDRLAMAAMQGLFSSSYDEFWIDVGPGTKTAQQAYRWADAMLKVREDNA